MNKKLYTAWFVAGVATLFAVCLRVELGTVREAAKDAASRHAIEDCVAAQSVAAISAAAPAPPSTADGGVGDSNMFCLDRIHEQQMDYIRWRGKHVQQLEACTAALVEATHALVNRIERRNLVKGATP